MKKINRYSIAMLLTLLLLFIATQCAIKMTTKDEIEVKPIKKEKPCK